jgi:hypothetical protein
MVKSQLAGDVRDGSRQNRGFYGDPVKAACDDWARQKAFHLRALSTDKGLTWQASAGRVCSTISAGMGTTDSN